jgi:hypothetical protein
MHWKYQFRRARPARLQPALSPPIRAPGHPAYPNGHATEAMLVALLLEQILPSGIVPAGSVTSIPPAGAEAGPLRRLARRIGRIREIMGVHTASDSRIAYKLAARSLPLILGCPSIAGDAAKPGAGTARTATTQSVITDERPLVASPPAAALTEPVVATTYHENGLLFQAQKEWL